jgi:hypothetical protein
VSLRTRAMYQSAALHESFCHSRSAFPSFLLAGVRSHACVAEPQLAIALFPGALSLFAARQLTHSKHDETTSSSALVLCHPPHSHPLSSALSRRRRSKHEICLPQAPFAGGPPKANQFRPQSPPCFLRALCPLCPSAALLPALLLMLLLLQSNWRRCPSRLCRGAPRCGSGGSGEERRGGRGRKGHGTECTAGTGILRRSLLLSFCCALSVLLSSGTVHCTGPPLRPLRLWTEGHDTARSRRQQEGEEGKM